MVKHGVFATQTATSLVLPNVAASGIPFVVGTAPVQSAKHPAQVNVPTLCTSFEEAVEKLGYSNDWAKFTLCEVMYAHFKLYGCQPVIFCNVLDTTSMTESVAAADMDVTEGKITLPLTALNDSNLVVKATGAEGVAYKLDTDYGTYYDGDSLVIEVLPDGGCADATQLSVAYKAVTVDGVDSADIVMGLEAVDLCMSTVATIPDLMLAPGFSGDSAVAAVMATKAEGINGLFKAKALIDLEADSYTGAIAEKANNNLTDVAQILCWPKVTLGDKTFHLSTQLAGLMATVDNGNGGCPYESPSNKALKCDGMVSPGGDALRLTKAQADMLGGNGIVTALSFMGQWTAWGSNTACHPISGDVKDIWIPVSRMFGWVGNTLIRSYWANLDKPMMRRLIDMVLNSVNIWLNGLTGSGYLLGGRVEFLDSENPITDLMAGKISFHVYLAPPTVAQEIQFVLEYDSQYLSVLG